MDGIGMKGRLRHRIEFDELHPGQKLLGAIWMALFGYMSLMPACSSEALAFFRVCQNLDTTDDNLGLRDRAMMRWSCPHQIGFV